MPQETNPNENFNKFAQSRFEAIKNKMKFDLENKAIQQISEQTSVEPITLTQDKVDEMMNGPISSYPENQRPQLVGVAQEVEFVDNTFSYIDSLELPNYLSMAVALIISGNKTNNTDELKNAIQAIRNQLFIVGGAE